MDFVNKINENCEQKYFTGTFFRDLCWCWRSEFHTIFSWTFFEENVGISFSESIVNQNADLIEVIFSKELSDQFYKNNFDHTVDYYFKFIQKNNLTDLKILNVRLKLENEINLNNYKIIEQIENCYFLENK